MFSLKQSRRQFLQTAGIALGAWGAQSATALASGNDLAVRNLYLLDPEWGAGTPGCSDDPHRAGGGCHACVACHRHAQHKRFASAAAADGVRAHRHCKCIVRSQAVSLRQYLAMFGPPASPGRRDSFDNRRDALYPIERRAYIPLVAGE